MAARENQGYLIAVIILVLMTLALALLAFLSYSNGNQLGAELEATKKKLALNEAENKIKDNAITAFKGMIGDEAVGTDDIKQAINNMSAAIGQATNSGIESDEQTQLRDIVVQFEDIVKGYEDDVRGTENLVDQEVAKQATYRELVQNLTALVAKMVNLVDVAERRVAVEKATAEASIAEKEKELQIARDATEEMRKELESVKAQALATEQRLKGEVQQATANLATRTTELQQFKEDADEQIANRDQEIKKRGESIASLQRTIKRLTRETFDIADGTISQVGRSINRVYTDLGARDGLRVNRVFTVYEKGTTNFDKTNTKGSVEVTRVFDDRSEARIVDEDPLDPILAGDLLLTPTWDPGIGLRYVLIGRFDLDGDDLDDTDKLVREIERNGGEVVARQDEEGNLIGEIDPTADFYVEGNAEMQFDATSNFVTTMQKMKDDAEKNTVSPIELDKLRKGMGLQNRARTIRYNTPKGGFQNRSNVINDR